MSVYIKGFPLPNNCGACPLRLAWCRERIYMVTRPERCPLVPVPPHGRLIDAGELLEWANAGLRFGDPDFHAGLWHMVSAIDDAPTIIPAEETNKEAADDQNNS